MKKILLKKSKKLNYFQKKLFIKIILKKSKKNQLRHKIQ